MWKAILLCALMGFVTAQKARFDNYKVFSVLPNTEEDVELLHQLNEMPNGFSFWDLPSNLNRSAEVMVAPHQLPEFQEVMRKAGMQYKINIENVQKVMDMSMSKYGLFSFDFTNYHTLTNIYKNLDDLASQYPDKVQVIEGGRTYEGRKIKGVKVSFKPNNPGVFLEGGIHAREWISSAVVMYTLHQLLTSKDANVRQMAESFDWYIFPVFNPDGYEYTHTNNRLWRKTRKPYKGLWGRDCRGSDPNRNWGYRWNTGGSSNNPCDETYAGSGPFSDVETESMSQYIKSIKGKFFAYVSFHAYSQLLLIPYGHSKDHLDNYNELLDIGKKTINALKKRYGTEYRTGNTAETIYVATGSSVDYVKGTYGTPLTYTYELRDLGRYGFLLPPQHIIPTGEETLDSLVAMLKEAKTRGLHMRV